MQPSKDLTQTVNTQVKLGPLTLKNPVITASGTYGFGEEYAELCPVEALGGITLKGITLNLGWEILCPDLPKRPPDC